MSDIPASGNATMDDLHRVTGISRARLAAAGRRGDVPLKKYGGKWYSRWEWINSFCQTGTWDFKKIERAPEPVRADEI